MLSTAKPSFVVPWVRGGRYCGAGIGFRLGLGNLLITCFTVLIVIGYCSAGDIAKDGSSIVHTLAHELLCPITYFVEFLFSITAAAVAEVSLHPFFGYTYLVKGSFHHVAETL
jgi:hypothetical protein